MKNLRMFQVKFVQPTDYKPSRVKITDPRHERSVILTKDDEFDRITTQAAEYLESKGIQIIAQSWDERTGLSYLLSENFTELMK